MVAQQRFTKRNNEELIISMGGGKWTSHLLFQPNVITGLHTTPFQRGLFSENGIFILCW
jgi:hypothetical protein